MTPSKAIFSHSKGQGAMEYLLLIGGVVLIATIVMLLLITSASPAGETILTDNLGDYITHVSLDDGGGGPVSPVCGNNLVESGEQCDDGNTTDGDGCSLSCQTESGGPFCGNLFCEGTEAISCPTDCSVTLWCGNGTCDGGEDFFSCPTDCGPPLDTNPPIVSLASATADHLVTLSYPAIDLEGSNPIAYIITSSLDITALNNLPIPGFDGPLPAGIAYVSPDIPIPGFDIYSLQTNEMSVAGIVNGDTVYFRVRACDSVGNCSAPPAVGASPLFTSVSVSIGSVEKVFDYSAQSCNILDLPDNPARFFRNNDGTLTLFSGDAPNVYVTKAPNFSVAALTKTTSPEAHICSLAALPSTNNSQPYTFNNQEWIFATYKEPSPSTKVHAIIHNEFHDTLFGNPCLPAASDTTNPCWYNVLTHAVSMDQGLSFGPTSAPQNLIAAAPDAWNPALITAPFTNAPYFYGYQGSTNIIQKDGYYYTIFVRETDPDNTSQNGHCIMRTNNLDNPSSWRGWNGKGYSYVMDAPYDYPSGNPHPFIGEAGCAIISANTLDGYFARGLTYNTFLGQYVLIGEGVVGNVCGFYFSLSPDLITWSPAKFLMDAKLPYGPCWNNDFTGLTPYPTLVDHMDTSTNFENTGEIAYVYYTYWNSASADRDLLRRQVTFTTP